MLATNKENKVVTKKSKKQNRLLKTYEAICLKYEYPGYVGEYRYLIYTPLSEEMLLEKYSKALQKYEPYYIVAGELFVEYVLITRTEERILTNAKNHEASFGYEDGVSECIHSEIQDEEEVPSELVVTLYETMERLEERKRVVEALEVLTPTQKRRIIAHFYEKKSSRTIAKDEGVNYSKVDNSIKAALKKLRKHLEE